MLDMCDGEFQITILHPSQLEEVLDFVNIHFVPYEVISRGLGATFEDLLEFHRLVIQEWLCSGLSVGIIHVPTESLAGLCLNKILTPTNNVTFVNHVRFNAKTKQLISILGQIEKEVRYFEYEDVGRVLEVALLCVHRKFSGKGLSYELIKESEGLGEKAGCECVTSQATGLASQHIFHTLQFEKIKDVNYESIRINGMAAHLDSTVMMGANSCRIFKKKLNSRKK